MLICRRTPLASSSISCSFVIIEEKKHDQQIPSISNYLLLHPQFIVAWKLKLTKGFHFTPVSSKGCLLENIILTCMWKPQYVSLLLSQEHTVEISTVVLNLQGTSGSNVSAAAQIDQGLLCLPRQSLTSMGEACPCFPWQTVVLCAAGSYQFLFTLLCHHTWQN